MIAPTLRLVVCYAIILPPLAILPALGQGTGFLALAIGSGLIIAALIDGACAGLGSRGIEVRLPSLVRMVKGRVGALEIGVENGRTATAAIRVGLPMPAEIASSLEFLIASVPAGVSGARLLWPCTPLSRGRFQIDACYLETRSFLGLWAFRKRHEGGCEIRVYPSLENERKGLAALFLNRGSLGIHARRQQGKGKDFERLREYVAGDGYEDIHWKATAKRRHPITKVFQIERTQEVYVAIDSSRLGARRPAIQREDGPDGADPNDDRTHLERFIAAALVLGLAARRQGDLFGVAAFSDRVDAFLRAGGGKLHYNACREQIFNLQPRMVNPDFEGLFTFIRDKVRRRALIVILTGLDDPMLADTFSDAVELICRQHLVVVASLRPLGARPVFSNPEIASTEEIYEALTGHALWHDLERLKKGLKGRGVEFALADSGSLCIDLVSRYMNVKQRQIL
jgi:uncharacterized protein (DUF58 family)